MTIPTVRKTHVEAAIKEIERNGVPKKRRSTRFCMKVGKRHYPPKYVLSLAVRNATGQTLLPEDHSGGVETNGRLETLGFEIVVCPTRCGGI